jgi:hypothetical protein
LIFCRFWPTAHYLAEPLEEELPNRAHVVMAVIGDLPPEERVEGIWWSPLRSAAICLAASRGCSAALDGHWICGPEQPRDWCWSAGLVAELDTAKVALWLASCLLWEHRTPHQELWAEAEDPPGHQSVSSKHVRPRPVAPGSREALAVLAVLGIAPPAR